MKTKRTLVITIIASAFAVGLAAQVAQTPSSSPSYSVNATGHLTAKKGPHLLKIKSEGEVVAELRLLKPARVEMHGLQVPQNSGALRTSQTNSIEIAAEGQAPWRISGAGLEVEVSQPTADKK